MTIEHDLARIAALDPADRVERARLLALRAEFERRGQPSGLTALRGGDTAAAADLAAAERARAARLVDLVDAQLAGCAVRPVAPPPPAPPWADLPPAHTYEPRRLTDIDLRLLDRLPADPAAITPADARWLEDLWRSCPNDADRRLLAEWRNPVVASHEAVARAARRAQAEAKHQAAGLYRRELAEAILTDDIAATHPEIAGHAHLVARERLGELIAAVSADRAEAHVAGLAAVDAWRDRSAVPYDPDAPTRGVERGRAMARRTEIGPDGVARPRQEPPVGVLSSPGRMRGEALPGPDLPPAA